MHKIQDYFQENLPSYLDLLRQMVQINSFTSNAQGVKRLAELTAEIFANLGFQAEFVPSENPNYAKHLFLTRPASNNRNRFSPQSQGEDLNTKLNSPTLALISHLDTVFPPEEESLNDFSWRPEGDRIYGPGTVDIKGGTVMIYMVLDAQKTFAPQAFDSIAWLIGLDASEEVLSDDFGGLCLQRLPENTLACLVFEGGTLPGNSIPKEAFPLVIARKGRATFRVRAFGKSAHAGNAHPQGANAILQIANTIQQIAAFTDYEKQITFNVGTVQGGSVVNRVPHGAEAEVEMRAFSPDIFRTGYDRMIALDGSSQVSSSDGYPCHVTVQTLHQTEPWPPNPATQSLYDIWSKAAALINHHVIPEARGGLSDGNLLWNHFPTLDGLGPAGANAHCSERAPDGSKDQEYVQVPSFVPKAMINTLAIMSLINHSLESIS
jgi:glutamate carboxypeptidase